MRPTALPPPWLLAGCAAALLAGCATAREGAQAAPVGTLVREVELARVRCLVAAPLENASDEPLAAGEATRALLSWIDPARTQVLPVEELRAIFEDTPLELGEGVPGSTAVELAELLGADAALYGSVEGRSRALEPDLLVNVRLVLSAHRELAFAATVRVAARPGEPVEAAVRRQVLDAARPMLDRLGGPGASACFQKERRLALRAAAVALRPGAAPGAGGAPESWAPGPGAARPALRTQRQRDWARRLSERGRVALDDVAFAGRTAALSRDGGLADLAVVLLADPSLEVRLEGFVDATGDPAGDARLSTAMAAAAAQRIVELGVEPGRLVPTGRGGESPRLPNFTVRGRAANRRVEVVSPR